MTIANAVNKKVVAAIQTAKGTIAAADLATAQILRFLTFNQNQNNETYKSNEMRPDKQVADVNLGAQETPGSMNGELSPETYKMFMGAILRKAWVAGEEMDVAATDNVAAASTSGAAGTFTRDDALGDFIADGFKVGDVVQWTGWDAPATANNAHNMIITNLTATVMTCLTLDGDPIVTRAKGDSVTCAVKGKKNWVPSTGHLESWFSIEHYYSDVDLSEVFIDCKIATMAVKVPASGIPTIDFTILGLDVTPKLSAASPYFSAALPITTTEVGLAGKAVVIVQGAVQTLATGIDFDITGNNNVLPPVIGTNVKPGISDGRVEVKGNLIIFFQDVTLRDAFRAGTSVSIYVVIPVSDDADADFLAFSIPAAVLTGATTEGAQEQTMSIPFQAKMNSLGGLTANTLDTTISIQDGAL